MSESYRTAKIKTHTVEYRKALNSPVYEFVLPQGRFSFQPWTWGAKNRVIDECVSYDATSQRFGLDVPKFNELVLLTTLKDAQQNGGEATVDLAMIRNLDAGLGDLLLDICCWVNHLDGTGPAEAGPPVDHVRQSEDRRTISIRAGDYTFTLRPWTWGEKNRILGECVTPDGPSHPITVATQKFNEQMLLTSLVEVTCQRDLVEVTAQFLQKMDARLGDALLEAAQKINDITLDEKKN